MVLLSAVATFVIFGIRLSFSVFFAEFVSVEGWSSEASAGIFSVSMLAFALGSAPGGLLLDRFGPRIVFSGGAVLLALGLFLSSRAQSVGQLTIAYGLIGGTGLSVIGLGQIAANISAWVPPAQRGRAIGIAFAGTGMGSLLFVPLATWLIEQIGWRSAYSVLSLLVLIVLVPVMAFGMQAPPTVAQKTRDPVHSGREGVWGQLVRNPLFWMMMLVSLTALGPLRSLTVHQIAYMESVGIMRQTAAFYVGLAGLLTVGTFIGWGVVSDRFGRSWAFNLGALCLICAVGILLLLRTSPLTPLLMVYALLYALGEGTRSSQTTALASDTFQSSGLGLINGLVGAMFGFGAAFGPWFVGRLRDTTGSYLPGLAVIVIMIVISMAGFLFIAYQKRSLRT